MASTFAKKAFQSGKSSIKTFKNQTPGSLPTFTSGDRFSERAITIFAKKALRKAVAGAGFVLGMPGIDSYTKLMLHFNESPLVDTMGKALTLNGNVTRSAIQNKFGGYSGYFDGNGDYITSPDSEDWNFGINDFTIDLWAYFTNFDNTYGLVSHAASGTTVNSNWSFFYSQTNGLHFSIREGGTFRVDIEQGSPTAGWVANTWYHLAAIRYGNTFNIYRNGISLGSDTWSGTMVSYSVPLNIGIARKTDGLITEEFYGYMDELRISNGIARWTANFTPPTSAYV